MLQNAPWFQETKALPWLSVNEELRDSNTKLQPIKTKVLEMCCETCNHLCPGFISLLYLSNVLALEEIKAANMLLAGSFTGYLPSWLVFN